MAYDRKHVSTNVGTKPRARRNHSVLPSLKDRKGVLRDHDGGISCHKTNTIPYPLPRLVATLHSWRQNRRQRPHQRRPTPAGTIFHRSRITPPVQATEKQMRAVAGGGATSPSRSQRAKTKQPTRMHTPIRYVPNTLVKM